MRRSGSRFLLGMSHAACTVNVVTTDGVAGRHGVTVSAMVSVSADTPQPDAAGVHSPFEPGGGRTARERRVLRQRAARGSGAHLRHLRRAQRSARRSRSSTAPMDHAAHRRAARASTRWSPSIAGSRRSERIGSHFVVFGSVARYLRGRERGHR